jgi:hypothetical protein
VRIALCKSSQRSSPLLGTWADVPLFDPGASEKQPNRRAPGHPGHLCGTSHVPMKPELGVLGVAIVQKIAAAPQRAPSLHGHVAGDLLHLGTCCCNGCSACLRLHLKAKHQQLAMGRDAPHFGFSLLIRWMRSRNSRSIFGRPARFRDFQRQNAAKPARCQRRMVSGRTTCAAGSRLGQSRVIQTSRTRSLSRSRRRERLKAMLS